MTSSIRTSLKYGLGWSGLLIFFGSRSDSVLAGLKVTSHLLDQFVIFSRSVVIWQAAAFGVSTIITSLCRQRTSEFRDVYHYVSPPKGRGAYWFQCGCRWCRRWRRCDRFVPMISLEPVDGILPNLSGEITGTSSRVA